MREIKHSRSILKTIEKYFGNALGKANVTEVCFNGDKYLRVLDSSNQWSVYETELTSETARGIASAIASEKGTEFKEKSPIMSATLPDAERIHIVRDPATKKGIISITIRKPSNHKISIEQYEKQGLFEIEKNKTINQKKNDILLNLYKSNDWKEFIIEAVKQRKTIIIAGATGSGKTTLMKTLMDYIPKNSRIISIEDTEELIFDDDRNYVQLFYPSEAKNEDTLNPTSLLKSSLRMKPDVILLAELRGAETFDFINAISSGHGGSITSCHAGSVEETFKRLSMMMLLNKNAQQLPYTVIEQILFDNIDVIIHMENIEDNKRITDIYYKEVEIMKKKDKK